MHNHKSIYYSLITLTLFLLLPFITFAKTSPAKAATEAPVPTLYGDTAVNGDEAVSNEESSDEDINVPAKGKPTNKESQGQGTSRRSRVANAVHELLAIADRDGGIGPQVREIAKSQQSSHEEAEKALEKVKGRKGWVKFLIGPNYKQISLVENRLDEINKQLEELKDLRGKLSNPEDSTLLDSQVEAIKQLQTELQAEVQDSKKGFSLFGWLNRLLSK